MIIQVSSNNSQVSSEDTAAAEAGAWTIIREALRGSHGEYTEGPIGRAILLLAVPMVLELALESVFAVVDVFFVGRLGADAVATVGLTEALMTIIYSALAGLSVGATATVARRIGEHDQEGAAIAAVQAIALGVVIAVPAGAAGAWFARPLLAFMGATSGVLAHSEFATILLGLNGVIVMLFLINAVFRGAGEAAVAMRVLWIANLFNLALDPCLIFGLGPFPQLGVTGAAVATTTGRSIGMLAQLYVLWRGEGRIVIRRRHLRLDPRVMVSMVRLSGVAVFQSLVGTTSYVGMMRIIASFGGAAVAACTITVRIIIFALLPSWGLANAAATLVGQNLGAGKPDRAETSAWRACLFGAFGLGVIGAVFMAFAPTIVGWFTTDAGVASIAARGLLIMSAGFVFFAAGYVLTQAFNGAGDTWTPTWINVGCLWMFEIPLAYVLAHRLGRGPDGVFAAFPIAFGALAIISAILFRRGTWKTKRV
jgi:MATE family, multidrug efflux pump